MSSINRDTANMDLHSTHIMQLPLDQDMDTENELCRRYSDCSSMWLCHTDAGLM